MIIPGAHPYLGLKKVPGTPGCGNSECNMHANISWKDGFPFNEVPLIASAGMLIYEGQGYFQFSMDVNTIQNNNLHGKWPNNHVHWPTCQGSCDGRKLHKQGMWQPQLLKICR